ncbi:MAG: hypothetical protein K940chlam2_00035 [Chlamydiae bacterium]|nr:hypothetical protein [Chlamydiota bacterium]
MRFNKKKLMEKPISALMATIHIEGIDATGIERTREGLSDLILLMAGQTYPYGGAEPVSGAEPVIGPNLQAPNQDKVPGASPRILRIREQAEAS